MVLSLEIHHCRSSNHGEAFRVQGGMERMRDADCEDRRHMKNDVTEAQNEEQKTRKTIPPRTFD